MIGQKGLPATYGGIEHHVEELGSRLAERGHDVTVYCRASYSTQWASHHRGMKLRHIRTVETKHLDAIVHSGLSVVDAMRAHADIIHLHALGPGLVAPLPRLFSRSKVVLTVHGRDDLRAKWAAPARAVLTAAEWMSGWAPNATIAVSKALTDCYANRPRHQTVYIPNGVGNFVRLGAGPTLDQFRLEPGRYLLWVGRLVPEKATDMLIRAFGRLDRADIQLAVVGGSSFTDRFTTQIHELAAADRRVRLTGYLFGDPLAELYSNALAFVLPSYIEGLPLTLLEAASYGLPIVASDLSAHAEVIGSQSLPGHRLFRSGDEEDLLRALTTVTSDPNLEREGARVVRDDVLARYSWDDAADATEQLYKSLLATDKPAPRGRPGLRVERSGQGDGYLEVDKRDVVP